MRFKDQYVIITGGTRGIGKSISEAFLSEGAHVLATYTRNQEAAEAFKASCASDRLSLYQFDVSKYNEVEEFFQKLDAQDIEVSILINSAGVRKDAIVGMMSEEDWDSVLDINLKGCFIMSKMAVQRMSRKRYGRIINITSPSGKLGFQGQGNYAASKAGMIGFTRSLCKEVAKRKITVNCVSPGFIDTELLHDLNDQQAKEYQMMVPLQRFGEAREVASGVLYLASAEASYITGTTLEISGGL
ncbi:MAG: 3-oxoacyl-ACP reductase FabG [Bdellovibrionales bacterium]|nr:3-oxoacyl-ACP reductase FabG [Bdellovibrionales bacterium]